MPGQWLSLSLDEPLKTLTTKESYGLCIPQLGAILDIRFRMLQPHELAAAMSFPKGYKFAGTRDQQVKQIGNAVPVRTAEALCKAILEN
jgi:DNA (cytosine-5)-methyltransferase 1